MVGTGLLKAKTIDLMDKRTAVDTEIRSIINRLCIPGGPGLHGNLLDSEGFPRSDIDIPTVRADRQRLAELRNDHKDLTDKIAKNIELLHAATLTSKSPTSTDPGLSRGGPAAMDTDVNTNVPFAMIDEITEGSPAAEDGLQLGDQILKFGLVEHGNNMLTRLASEAQDNKGCAIPLVVLRQGVRINLSVMPREWPGRGLLGCHFRIL